MGTGRAARAGKSRGGVRRIRRRILRHLVLGEYAILGVCDGQCSDLDLDLYLDGARVGGDFEPDARPVVSFRADSGTRARVVVTAPGCEGRTTSGNWYCTYGVQLMGR